MINERVGERVETRDQISIRTKLGSKGYALYGPYEPLHPGKYAVKYSIKPIARESADTDVICASVDIACGNGKIILAQSLVYYSEIQADRAFQLNFDLHQVQNDIEYRVFVNGSVPLIVADRPTVGRVANAVKSSPKSSSPFFDENVETFARLWAAGVQVKIVGPDVILANSGVSFLARCRDDLNFIGEVFLQNAYNIITPRAACVIDVGMNIGFTSLRLAARDDIEEVHAFEPFKSTFERASANVALNPHIAGKIQMSNFGLSDKNEALTVKIDSTDSGSYSVLGSDRGEATRIEIRDAAAVLKPIINSAKARGLLIIMKVDCEGSEFAIFKTLISSGLLYEMSALMVEWHSGWGSHHELTAPLIKAGFSVIDLGARAGNGFFYAIKTGT